ncbi:unnamed protein product [Heligmosomoides polygyrus]|uniref:Yippee domain-containing protein n=1 Tax=Heligmosomoides polygyrus TaxID=6339 RepID=A0A3P8ARF2_HELPZ|nr:unnamed protein product [Heligmosomoides polygyrus]
MDDFLARFNATVNSSFHFLTGSSGRAMLFHRAWNLDYSEAQHRDMMTGKHIVRDVMCRICHKKVGWMYEFAMEDSQRYKEARIILEKALVDEEDGFPDPSDLPSSRLSEPTIACVSVFLRDLILICIPLLPLRFISHPQMPRMFFEHWGGRRTFSCEKCGTYLSNRQEVVSTRFSGTSLSLSLGVCFPTITFPGCTGRAFLFRRVANTRQGSPVVRKLTTGNHLVRDVYCLCCDTKLGWLYEFTNEDAERYKEGGSQNAPPLSPSTGFQALPGRYSIPKAYWSSSYSSYLPTE